jgi:hypothetical protein
MVDAEVFRRLAFEVARREARLPDVGESEVHLHVADLHYPRLREALKKASVEARLLTPVTERRMVQYQAQAQPSNHRRTDLVTALTLAQPTFGVAIPSLKVNALRQDHPLTLEVSTPSDPRRFPLLRWGRWIDADGNNDVILPIETVKELFPGREPSRALGERVELQFARERAVSDVDPTLTLSFKLVGISEGKVGHASLSCLQGIALWGQGKVIYSESRKAFISPVEIYQQAGHVRCTIDVSNAESVPALVEWLDRQGYRSEHHLAEQQGLHKLGRVLVFLVLFFVVGFAATAAITVLISNAMNIASKTHEIGILRAQGVSSREIVSIFALQGFLGGAAAFLLGALLVVLVEPLFSEVVRGTFKLPSEAIELRLVSPSHWPLFVLALGLALLATTFGALLPALKACRLSPVQAMQRQE